MLPALAFKCVFGFRSLAYKMPIKTLEGIIARIVVAVLAHHQHTRYLFLRIIAHRRYRVRNDIAKPHFEIAHAIISLLWQ
ncbi:hypothetical protein CEXT_670161 [Caerostris extrusa]|uniref:Secreted protein n=1 Tax=Caerostris extrusa TaxID=172846 RepID=A0AAV4WIK7_CAEEX|nr:hypothetical protein CEXT_670161 [Caerostris extrusa]